MEKFIVRGPLKTTATKNKRKSPGPEREEADSGAEGSGRSKKRPKLDASHQSKTPLVGASWKHIRAEGLNCDYRILFNKAEADRIFQELEKEVEYFEAGEFTKLHIFGKWHNIPRKQVTYGDAGLTYTYSGVTFSPKPWIPVLGHIRDQIQLTTGDTFNFVLINRYKDGHDHMGEHRDDERELAPRSPIASVSFGACRDFVFRHKDSRGKNPSRYIEAVKLQLEHGSLLMMNFPTNRYWYHSLPSRKKLLAPRINLTFRNVMALTPGQ
uniref:DNA oxidative demethylase ALKBH2 n=1 Tax=Podarcis muralis TaxID=64176 RepID=A0A670J6V8_PODMU|nr:DNA oxidative demethylase ALKBH2 isoform X1 [Podarcis muralis]XP_028559698.1 DNA oxidative demethylase ALKBH2 isoform X1 [Podarcis muralis]XP_028559699.1 DNA oxidative demethylase ALKBH2 isoform X1 [Podarcis muralis]XP_028559701.1 DNA oxidative demethylase ALKBH2 isoform X1 [Podarcis muralis]XP_028559702.1 DNA oxidative demethylase ALKBH2 isoform X1 [Podarcis muralis]XP_028559703.1 DNA oxidative demethylase ALKBH2 isoform X1 [Podarcis muralis]XP_028559704.1 DNA oxidative demethylase ALKBH2